MINVDSIAKVCHEVNRAYCMSLGDDSQPTWEDAPKWQMDSAINGVRFVLESPDAGPGAQHIIWMEHKIREGWKYGPVKSELDKTHPCIMPFNKLPKEQQAKDFIVQRIVLVLSNTIFNERR